MYTNTSVNISDGQKKKIKKALKTEQNLSLRLSHDDLVGNDLIALTQSQFRKLHKAYNEGKGVIINLSKTQLRHNMKVEGGFLPMLAGLASQALPFITGTVLPALGVGALSGLANTGVQKLLGNGLYLKKGGCICEVETDGKRLLLEPLVGYRGKELTKYGDGLYLKTGKQIRYGDGLLLGPNSPFNNIPILGMLL